jgi:hypothetical protein
MSQITIYLDEETEHNLKQAAKAAGQSVSKWIADLVRTKVSNEWPASVAALVGAWSDFPEAEELRAAQGADIPREPF